MTWSVPVTSCERLEDQLLNEYAKAKSDVLAMKRKVGDLTVRERAGMLIKVFEGATNATRAAKVMPPQMGGQWNEIIELLHKAEMERP